ncbi:acyltransferase [Paraburkholderia sp. BL10I2N1]|uniref:acyltransferase family protein n=1 Tax=Paraburkholderia sp. BL10I2N1 TaxID=1938796 RepID=UPI00105BB773|nr:acyltransferase [Paraburkholderia sp. BL10I2N1]TDN70080.1 peptidoglycan/LPS O-acetylase OafA/YrhL [Paraburkholderia sp. BL10I2N1]
MSDPALDASASSLPFPAAPRGVSRAQSVPKEHIIDALRGLAALLVAYFHCRQVTWVGMQNFHQTAGRALDLNTIVSYLTFPVAWGSAGVPVFFVISGYCIHRSAAQRLAANPAYRLDTVNFWARRFARIYPVLLAALLLTFALDWASHQLPPVNHKLLDIGPRAFLVNLFSLQGVAGKTYGSNGALWTLSIEVQFYAIYPLLFALRRRFGMTPVLAMIALINVASAFALERHEIQFFTSYWLSWTIGAWIAEARVRTTPDSRAASPWLYLIAFVFMALGCIAFHFGQYAAFQLWAAGFACYLYKALDQRGDGSNTRGPGSAVRLLSRVGDFSFSLYLIHLPIFVLLSSLLFRSAFQVEIWPSFAFMLVAIPVAYVFYRLVELPAMKWSASLKPKAKAARV